MNEFLSREEALSLNGVIGGGPLNLEVGDWTDDTSMVLCLVDALLAEERYDSEVVVNAYADWCFRRRRSSTGRCFDIGTQVAAAIDDFLNSRGVLVSVERERTSSAGNGCIVCLAPVVIAGFTFRRLKDITSTARISAQETYYLIEAEAVTEVFAALLVGTTRGLGRDQLLDVSWASTGSDFDEVVQQTVHWDADTRALSKHGTNGYVIHDLALVIHGFMDFDSFEEGALMIVSLGGDVDTNVAIYGQFAGAFYGVGSIPRAWREILFEGEEICSFADVLLGLPTSEKAKTRFVEDL